MTKNATLEASSARAVGGRPRAQPMPRARARSAIDPTAGTAEPTAPAALATSPASTYSGTPSRLGERKATIRVAPNVTYQARYRPTGRASQTSARGRVKTRWRAVPTRNASAAPDVARPIVSRTAASAGRRGAMTTAAIPAAVAPTTPDWNAHRMSSPPDPSSNMTAIAPSAQVAVVSRLTTT